MQGRLRARGSERACPPRGGIRGLVHCGVAHCLTKVWSKHTCVRHALGVSVGFKESLLVEICTSEQNVVRACSWMHREMYSNISASDWLPFDWQSREEDEDKEREGETGRAGWGRRGRGGNEEGG